MTRVSATEFKNNIGSYSDAALSGPVIITSHQRDRLVLMSAEEYRRLTGQGEDAGRSALLRRRAERHAGTLTDLSKR